MQRRKHTDALKSRMVLEALMGVKTINEIAKKYQVHPTMITKWKKQVVEQLPTLFSKVWAPVKSMG